MTMMTDQPILPICFVCGQAINVNDLDGWIDAYDNNMIGLHRSHRVHYQCIPRFNSLVEALLPVLKKLFDDQKLP